MEGEESSVSKGTGLEGTWKMETMHRFRRDLHGRRFQDSRRQVLRGGKVEIIIGRQASIRFPPPLPSHFPSPHIKKECQREGINKFKAEIMFDNSSDLI